MVEYIRRRVAQHFEGTLHAALAAEIRREYLQPDAGIRRAHFADAIGEMTGAAVAQIVAIDRSDHDIAQAHVADRGRQVPRFLGIRWLRPAVCDVAERAATRA